jgi:hypothetical protein
MDTTNAQQAIRAALDSVNLINRLVTGAANDNIKKTVERNVDHLELMMTKDFFSEALTSQQRTDIETSISAGKSFIQ